MSNEKSYEKGVQDGVKLWASGCDAMTDCDECPIGVIKGMGVSCQAFCKQFPAKAVSLLREMEGQEIDYVAEYNMRFPDAHLDAQALYDNGVCRKLVFEGWNGCEGGDCIACWKERFTGDTTEDIESEE